RLDDFIERRESEQPAARGEDVAEARVLSNHRPAGSQVLRAALAEPAAAEADVLVFGHSELSAGPGDIPPVDVEIARDAAGRPKLPAVALKQPLVFVVAARQSQLERLNRAAGQVEKLQEFVVFAPVVDLAPELDLARLPPVSDRRERFARPAVLRLPEVEED